jgi:hypothetical protein
MSPIPLVSPAATFGATEPNTTKRPSGVMKVPPPRTMFPFISTETALVLATHPGAALMQVSRRKTHAALQSLVLGRMLVASDSKTTYLPFALIPEPKL